MYEYERISNTTLDRRTGGLETYLAAFLRVISLDRRTGGLEKRMAFLCI